MSSRATLELYSEIASDLRPLAPGELPIIGRAVNKALADRLTAHGVEGLASERSSEVVERGAFCVPMHRL
jgi:hypothetical protein